MLFLKTRRVTASLKAVIAVGSHSLGEKKTKCARNGSETASDAQEGRCDNEAKANCVIKAEGRGGRPPRSFSLGGHLGRADINLPTPPNYSSPPVGAAPSVQSGGHGRSQVFMGIQQLASCVQTEGLAQQVDC